MCFFDKWIRVKVVMLAVFVAFPAEAVFQTFFEKFPLMSLIGAQGGLLSIYILGEWRKNKRMDKEKIPDV